MSRNVITRWLLLALACGPLGHRGSAVADSRIDFARDVRPVLTRHCIRCHGDQRQEGGLRLSSRSTAFAAADTGSPVIVPGKPDASLLLQRVTSDTLGDRMPADSPPMSEREAAILRRWILEGAKWPETQSLRHWAYVAPQRPVPPDVPVEPHGNPIDQFIDVRLRDAALQPNPRADKAQLLRRASLTLTGLPPGLDELDAFLADQSDAAWERAVDRLLASPRYGERWAQHWLDLARYADSNGFQADQLRDIWPYRDWVIDAMNRDMPFDQFTIEQLAGDLLPDASVAQRVATGFHRTVPCNVEAGVHPEENRHNQVFDRVNTTGTVFLGTTIECCQCHDHKYDPFTQRDYYRLFAFFNNTPLEVKLNSGVQYELEGPQLELPLPGPMERERQNLTAQQARLQARRAAMSKPGADRSDWEQQLRDSLQSESAWQPLKPGHVEAASGETLTVLADSSVLASGPLPDKTSYTIRCENVPAGATALRIEALTHESLPGKGPGRGDVVRNNFILSEVRVTVRGHASSRTVAVSSATADFSQKKWPVANAIDGRPETGWAIAPQFSKPHHAVLVFEQPLQLSADEVLEVQLDQNYGRGRTMGRVRLSAFRGPAIAATLSDTAAEAIRQPPARRTKAQQKAVDELFLAANPELRRIDKQLKSLRIRLEELRPTTTLVMKELPEPRTTHLLNRGNYLDPGPAVTPGTPGALHAFDTAGYPPDRLGLARWLVSRDNPLLARVVVNRWWNEIFGRGIVTTVEDFGTQSEPPTHPELLDWLAVEFMDSGWSMKRMHKLMVMSAAFQRSSVVSSEALHVDPRNTLYARGPRYRLPAETIRDTALAVSGLLSEKFGGPPVMPYQPDGIWRAVGRNAPKWKMAGNEDRFRRGVYVVWRRAAPYPSFVNFDAPDRTACVVARPRTNTPLQALTLLNDPAYIEMALGLAARMLRSSDDETRRLTVGFRLCVARQPTDDELRVLREVLHTETARLSAEPQRAAELFRGVPGYTPPQNIDHTQLAAWFAVANILLNLDETITNG